MSTPNNEGTPTQKERMAPVQGYSAGIPWSMHRIHQNERINQMTPAEIKASNLRELEKFRAESSTPPAGAEPHNYATPPMPCTDGEGGPDLTDTLNKIASRAGAKPSPEEAAAREIDRAFYDEIVGVGIEGLPYTASEQVCNYTAIIARHFAPLRAELESVRFIGNETQAELRKAQRDLTAARARIGEMEKEREKLMDGKSFDELTRDALIELNRQQYHEIALLRSQLALANAKYEEARRAGCKCFDESHPT